jgi:hypothetical protein
LILSAEEEEDLAIPDERFTLGQLAATQARADFEALDRRGRRALHIHLKANDARTLSQFANRFCHTLSAI